MYGQVKFESYGFPAGKFQPLVIQTRILDFVNHSRLRFCVRFDFIMCLEYEDQNVHARFLAPPHNIWSQQDLNVSVHVSNNYDS